MKNGHIKVCLWPLNGGSYTRLQLTCVTPTALSARELRRLAQKMSFWSDAPIECVLSVDEETAAWCEWWIDRLADIPARLLEVLFVARDKKRGMGSDCQ